MKHATTDRTAATVRAPEASETVEMGALGSMLRARRDLLGLSVREAARIAGVSFSTITRVESGAQPDLATFLKLCAWMEVRPETFFMETPTKATSSVEAVVQHLYADPSLPHSAADQIATVVRDLYRALRVAPPIVAPIACHLRAAPMLRAGVPEMLHGILTDLHAGVVRLVDEEAE